jgi:hypothetical protein
LIAKECVMLTRKLVFAVVIAALPMSAAFADDGDRTAPPSGQTATGAGDTTATVVKPLPSRPFEGLATDAPFSPTGTSELGKDGLSLVTEPARPCSVTAQETDGTTTCIGIPKGRR